MALEGPGLELDENAERIRAHLQQRFRSLVQVVIGSKERFPKESVGAFIYMMVEPADEREIKHEILEKKGLLHHWSPHLAEDLIREGADPNEATHIQQVTGAARMPEIAAVTPEEHVFLNALTTAERTRRYLDALLSDAHFVHIPAAQKEIERETTLELPETSEHHSGPRQHLEVVPIDEIFPTGVSPTEKPKLEKRR